MVSRFASATLLLLLFACDEGPACVIDTDCEGFQICVDESCVPRGSQRDATVDGPGDGSTGGDGGGADDAGPADMGPEPGSLGTGLVSALSVPGRTGGLAERPSHSVSASFTAAGGGPACTTSEVGDCRVVTCDPPPSSPADGGMPEPMVLPHAGAIQVASGDVTVTLVPTEETGLYAPVTGTVPLFVQGQAMVARAPGDAVPSFRSSGIEGVDQLAVTAPALPDTGPLGLDSTMPTEIRWTVPETPTEDQTVRIGLTSVVGDGGSVSITCDAPVTEGTFTLTPEIFETMPGSASHRIRVITRDSELLDREGWLIEVEAWARGRVAARNFDLPVEFTDRPPAL